MKENLFTSIIVLSVIFVAGLSFYLGYIVGPSSERCKSCQMCRVEFDYGLTGIYFPSDKFYCVWAEGRTLLEQQKTEEHEICHFLIDQDSEHFLK